MPTPKTTPPAAEKLLPCPFCGDTGAECEESEVPSIRHDGKKMAVFCNTCFCEGPTHDWGKDAIDAWNIRAILGPNTEGTAAPGGATQIPMNTKCAHGFYMREWGHACPHCATQLPQSSPDAPPVQRGVRTEAEEALIRQVLHLHLNEGFPNEAGLTTLANRVSAERAALADKETPL